MATIIEDINAKLDRFRDNAKRLFSELRVTAGITSDMHANSVLADAEMTLASDWQIVRSAINSPWTVFPDSNKPLRDLYALYAGEHLCSIKRALKVLNPRSNFTRHAAFRDLVEARAKLLREDPDYQEAAWHLLAGERVAKDENGSVVGWFDPVTETEYDAVQRLTGKAVNPFDFMIAQGCPASFPNPWSPYGTVKRHPDYLARTGNAVDRGRTGRFHGVIAPDHTIPARKPAQDDPGAKETAPVLPVDPYTPPTVREIFGRPPQTSAETIDRIER